MTLSGQPVHPGEFPRSDAGKGKLADYRYNLTPNNARVTITLAGSDPYQDELAELAAEESLRTFIATRTVEDERTDAPMPVRFQGRRMSGVVGWVPRGLEPAVIEALARIADQSENRIPAEIVRARGKYRVILQLGATR